MGLVYLFPYIVEILQLIEYVKFEALSLKWYFYQ